MSIETERKGKCEWCGEEEILKEYTLHNPDTDKDYKVWLCQESAEQGISQCAACGKEFNDMDHTLWSDYTNERYCTACYTPIHAKGGFVCDNCSEELPDECNGKGRQWCKKCAPKMEPLIDMGVICSVCHKDLPKGVRGKGSRLCSTCIDEKKANDALSAKLHQLEDAMQHKDGKSALKILKELNEIASQFNQ